MSNLERLKEKATDVRDLAQALVVKTDEILSIPENKMLTDYDIACKNSEVDAAIMILTGLIKYHNKNHS